MSIDVRIIAILVPFAAGCLGAQSHEGLSPIGDAPPGGPWTDCFAALEDGAVNDPCALQSGCSKGRTETGMYEMAVCLDGVLLKQSIQAGYTDECLGATDVEYVGLDEHGCAVRERCELYEMGVPGLHLRRQHCVADAAPRAPTVEEPWPLYDNDDCNAMFAARGRSGDPCVGEGACFGEWPDAAGGIRAFLVAWCRDGAVVIAEDQRLLDAPTVDP